MIVITGAAGFIGSNILARLNEEFFFDLLLVDKFNNKLKNKNLIGKTYSNKVDRDHFPEWFEKNHKEVEVLLHMGARTDTAEFNKEIFDTLNLNYSKKLWDACSKFKVPLIYASSAATYGMGEHGYRDDHEIIEKLKPLNPYGESKNDFDKWVLKQSSQPPFWAGLKFFNVFGPNEYHKGRMASVVFHAFNQIKETGKMKLFRSHNPEFKDGEQKRDFIYVKDVVDVILFLMMNKVDPGIYNLGTGKARTFIDLVNAVFCATGYPSDIEFVDIPEDIRDKYQYFTEAEMDKLSKAGYVIPFSTLEQAVDDYVKSFLVHNSFK